MTSTEPQPPGERLEPCADELITSLRGRDLLRGQARDYDLWRQMGCAGWGWDDVLPYFRKSEDYYLGADEMHGAGGEWRVEEARVRWDVLDAFQAAAEAASIPRTDDFNRGDNEGSSYFKVNQRRGIRWNTSKAFLRPVRHRRNLRIETHAHARRLIIEEMTAKGVEFDRQGVTRTVHARREVILAAGAVAFYILDHVRFRVYEGVEAHRQID
jgi:choline dehydrogenase-like flavoprotein